jgi:hypothetical protein
MYKKADRIREKKRKEEPTYPIWTCPNGHPNQLDFDPTRKKLEFNNYKCKCGKGTKI